MPREKLAHNRNDIVRHYANGMSAAGVGRLFGVTTTTVTRILKAEGVMLAKRRGEARKRADEAEIISAFADGMRPVEVMAKFGIERSTLYGWLHRRGIKLRGHIGEIGIAKTLEQRLLAAKGRERIPKLNANEQRFADILTANGIEFLPQVATSDGGNIDFVVPSASVAVEVCLRGTTSKYLRDGWLIKRIRECAQRGLHLYIFVGLNSENINDNSTKDVFAWLDFLGRSPAARRQYRMVSGGTELLATGCSDDDDITLKGPLAYAMKRADRQAKS